MERRKKKFLIYAIYWMFLLLMESCAFVSVPLWQPIQPLKEKTLLGKGKEKILLIDIAGILTGDEKKSLAGFPAGINHVAEIREVLEKAAQDKKVKALILRINSPGGTATASDIIHQEILRFKEKKKILVFAALMNIAASGGYYIATAADKIIAHPTTITGSIGVIAMKFNLKGLMDRVGIEEESIKSGDKKDLFSPYRGTTEEEKKIIQEIIDSLHQRFLNVVEQGRKGLSSQQIKELADGRVFTAQQAQTVQLIDGIGYLTDTFEMVKRGLGVKDARLILYHRPRSYKNNIYSQASIQLFNLGDGDVLEYLPVRFMYLWSP